MELGPIVQLLEIRGAADRAAAAGLHVLLRLSRGADDAQVAEACQEEGIRVSPLSVFASVPGDAGRVLGFGRMREEDVEPAVQALCHVLADRGVLARP